MPTMKPKEPIGFERELVELLDAVAPSGVQFARTCQEAKAAVSRMRSRADECFHGRW